MIFALAGLAGMLLMALLDGEWTRWRARRNQLPMDDLRRLLGACDPQPAVRRLPRRPFDWAQD